MGPSYTATLNACHTLLPEHHDAGCVDGAMGCIKDGYSSNVMATRISNSTWNGT